MCGSKGEKWKWCAKCPKCLFVFTILSPYLYKNELVSIFGTDMFEDKEMLNTFIELTGNGKTKPFECVGTYEEVNFAVSTIIKKLEENGENLPYLLKYYKDNFKLSDLKEDITKRFNNQNNLSEEQIQILKEAVFSD